MLETMPVRVLGTLTVRGKWVQMPQTGAGIHNCYSKFSDSHLASCKALLKSKGHVRVLVILGLMYLGH